MMKFWMILVGIAFTTPVAVAQTDSITDIEGNVYKTVQIGTQWWMAENLKVTQYTNGDAIPHLTGATEWANTTGGAYCYYENKTGFADTYGNLYNWHTVADARGVCPQGWHIPSDEEWITLEMHLGMSRSEADRISTWRGTDQGDQLKSGSFGGNNSSGFSVLGTGYRDPEGVYKAMGTDSDYWTSTPYDNQGFTEGVLHGFLNTRSDAVRNFHVPGYGFCIRCVRDQGVQVEYHPEGATTVVYPNPVSDYFTTLVEVNHSK